MATKPLKKPLDRIPTRKLAANLKRELRQVLKEKMTGEKLHKSQSSKVLPSSQE